MTSWLRVGAGFTEITRINMMESGRSGAEKETTTIELGGGERSGSEKERPEPRNVKEGFASIKTTKIRLGVAVTSHFKELVARSKFESVSFYLNPPHCTTRSPLYHRSCHTSSSTLYSSRAKSYLYHKFGN